MKSMQSRKGRGRGYHVPGMLNVVCKCKEIKCVSRLPCASCRKATAWRELWVGWGWSRMLLVWFLGCSLRTPHLQAAQSQTCVAQWTVRSPAGGQAATQSHQRNTHSQMFSGMCVNVRVVGWSGGGLWYLKDIARTSFGKTKLKLIYFCSLTSQSLITLP